MDNYCQQTLDRRAIAARIPHAGTMCLLDEILSWDADHVHARSRSHHAADNPLIVDGRLHAVHLVEYAAQAAAVHGGLMAEAAGAGPPPSGRLAGLRRIELRAPFVENTIEWLEIKVSSLLAQDAFWLYHAEVRGDGQLLLDGRLAIHLII